MKCLSVVAEVFTQIDHQQAPQRRVEGGPTSHVAQVGLVVYPQEGEVLALTTKQDVKNDLRVRTRDV